MTQQISPWLEGAYGWNFGESGWNSGMDQNLLKFSFMFDRNVDSIVTSLPAAVNGQAHYLTTDNRLYFAVGTTYFSTPVPKWFTIVVRSTGQTYQFNGTSLVSIDSPSQLDSRLDAVELTISTLGTAAFQTVEFFATQAELDVAVADAAAYTDAAPFVRQVLDVATLRTAGSEGRFANDKVELLGYFSTNPGVGGGELYWDNTSTEADNGGTVFAVSGITTGRWKRPLGNAVFLEWFGIVGDGVTLEQGKIQSAIDATPAGGTLFGPYRAMTVLMDIPLGQGAWPAAFRVNKPITVLGNRNCTFKLKNFVASYVDYSAVLNPGLSVCRVQSGGVIIDGLHIDANADNHYEVDGSNVKHWEEGPLLKRPPNGILVLPEIGQANIENVKVQNCLVERPLGGIVASGTLSLGGPTLDEPTFFTGQLATDTVVNCEFTSNEVRNARGNDYLFVSGVRNSSIHDNKSVNSMYHNARFYAGVESCHMYNNHATVDYTKIESRWNQTDLGFWRNDNPASPSYKIQRSGFTIGSTSASTAANSGNIRRCSMKANIINYASQTAGGTIADFTQNTMASFFSWVVTNEIKIEGNESNNSPAHGLGAIISVTDPFNTTAQGVIFQNNIINNAARRAMSAIGAGFIFTGNTFVNCGTDGSGLSVVYVQGGSRVYRNSLVWQRSTANTNNLFEVVAYGPAGAVFLSDNLVNGYTGARLLNAGGIVVHGTDGGGVPLTLLNSWALAQSGDVEQRNDPRLVIDCAGNVSIEGFVAITGSTSSDTIFSSFDAKYRPVQNQYLPSQKVAGTGSDTFRTRVTRAGNVIIDRQGSTSAELFISGQWKGRTPV